MLLQHTFGTKAQQLVETFLGPQYLEQISKNREIQNANTRKYQETSLQIVEWVTSIDLNDGNFHITIHTLSRKYYISMSNFKELPFGLSTAPVEFTVVVKIH